ncbi:uncharacterized protein FOBCDRAFT_227695 [Fusarium oxysporum Fo47]|uniref:Uncharacterized protein n=1 Tax=Fusarium oxysporum Fo47 TaxID=660027 RepID=W9JGR8_FUSOX|nr:uncharacterized protein FOBCDRAFT_227695 [Fusarium oxysporum Fo47]EWZ28653.1 hypothetical protein FOZG_17658 [Fusarium oxysporum Fo47]QKD57142.1 hypothetical protein FOBCDRAFT_227695 [Fusarium oxysporum Fo47]
MPRRKLAGARDRRRRQNAEAQRAYRTRQKEKVQHLELIAMAAWCTQGLSVTPQPSNGEIGPFLSPVMESSASPTLYESDKPLRLMASEIYQSLLALPERQTAKCFEIMAREDFALRDIVKYGLIDMGYAMSPTLYSRAAASSSLAWIDLVRSSCGGVDMKQAVTAGVKILARLTVPGKWQERAYFEQSSPRLCTNTITLSAMSFISALHANAVRLKMAPDTLMANEAQSQFYHPANTCYSGFEPCSIVDNWHTENIPPDLRPTFIQQSLPHHPCHDLIPWASFRTKVIRFSWMNPPLIDEDDLCLDMLSGGIRCWGSTMGSMHGRGQGVPWDSRSWEAMPWFLEKWKLLSGGEGDDMSRTSAWWRCLQGIDMNHA